VFQEAAPVSVIPMVVGDQVMTSAFSVLGTGCRATVSNIVISQMAIMQTQLPENVGHAILNVSTHAPAQSV